MPLIFKALDRKFRIENDPGKTLLEHAKNVGLYIKSNCGGVGTCGRCYVNLQKGEFVIEDKETIVVKHKHRALSCLTKAKSYDAVIEIPAESLVEASGQMEDEFLIKHFEHDPQTIKLFLTVEKPALDKQFSDAERIRNAVYRQSDIQALSIPLPVLQNVPDVLPEKDHQITATYARILDQWRLIRIESGDTTATNYAVAIDIGTTTVAGLLIDLTTSEILSRASLYNQQIKVAEDVISRISYCKSQKDVTFLQNLIVQETMNPVIKQLCTDTHISPDEIHQIALSANTIMMHLALGLNPSSIGKVPFQPVTNHPDSLRAEELGIDINKNGVIDIIPSVSGYIGGDIVSDIYLSKLDQRKGFVVLIDIGTNGEIVTSEDGTLTACSTAAGPAFEGYGLYHGSRASDGAIEKVSFEGEQIHVETIGSTKASGICGTGIIDFIAEALRTGLISRSGRFDEGMLKTNHWLHTVQENDADMTACVIAREENSQLSGPVVVSQSDIVKIMQAKAAIYAGLQTLMNVQEKKWDDIDRLILTGGFARHINYQNAVQIGLLPDIPSDRIEIIGNGSLGGAFLTLVEKDALEKMHALTHQPRVIELNKYKNFQKNFIDAMFFNV